MIHFNELRPDELERLAILSEECGEVVQIIGKILRHGLESRHPMYPDLETNRENLIKEVGDVLVAIDMLTEAGDINEHLIEDRKRVKRYRIQEYLHHQG